MIPWQAPAASEQQKTVEDGEEADEEDGEADTRGGTSVIMPSMPSHVRFWRVYITQIDESRRYLPDPTRIIMV